jgi:hypothetical protein
MSSSLTFSAFLLLMQDLYYQYAKKNGFDGVETTYTFTNRIRAFYNRYLGTGEAFNAEERDSTYYQGHSNVLDPQEFVMKVIESLEKYLILRENNQSLDESVVKTIHEQWEQEAHNKICELMKINSYTNKIKHKRLFDLLSGSAVTIYHDPNQEDNHDLYFSSYLKKNTDYWEKGYGLKPEADKFLTFKKEINSDMNYNGMPLSLNERINLLTSKYSQIVGLYGSLKKKQEE